jgi:hypothetical protein
MPSSHEIRIGWDGEPAFGVRLVVVMPDKFDPPGGSAGDWRKQ